MQTGIAFLLAATALWAGTASAQTATPSGNPLRSKASAPEPTGESLVKTEFLADTDRVVAGQPFRVAVVLTVAPEWHVYWKNPGESGAPVAVDLQLPEGFTASALEWPAPEVFIHPGETTIGYSGTAILMATVTPPATLPATARHEFKAGLTWLVCKDKCLFGRRDHALTLPVNATGEPRPADPRLAAAKARQTKPATEVGIEARLDGGTLVIEGPAAAQEGQGSGQASPIRFLPLSTPGIEYGAPTFEAPTVRDGRFVFRIPLTVRPQDSLGQPLHAAGAVVVGDPKSPRLYTEVDLPVPGK